jgi:hypothetical protein
MGQERDVHVYYFVAEKTVEVNILEERTGKVLVERGGECLLVSEIQGGDRKDFGGLPFLGAACGAGVDVEDDEDGE